MQKVVGSNPIIRSFFSFSLLSGEFHVRSKLSRLVVYQLSGTRSGLTSPPRRTRQWATSSPRHRLLSVAPELPKPDIRPQLRKLVEWYDDVLERIASGALVEPGVAERLKEQREFAARHLELLETDEESSQATE